MSTYSLPGITSPTKQSRTTNVKANRLPAPTLFVGPPSRNASQLSVSKVGLDGAGKGGRPSANRQKSTLNRTHNADGDDDSRKDGKDQRVFKKPSEKSIDAKWREMQSTLNEVELTAQSSTHVFGESHTNALDRLRQAQVALARAWGRGSEDKVAAVATGLGTAEIGQSPDGETTLPQTQRQRADTTNSVSTVLSDESALSEETARSGGKSQLEDETAQDIKLAGERRAANESYFKKVDEGVKDVVEKLEKVAEAMRGVEGESRSLWSNSDRDSTEVENEQTKAGLPSISIS